MIRWSFWVDAWEHPFNTWNKFYSVMKPLSPVKPKIAKIEFSLPAFSQGPWDFSTSFQTERFERSEGSFKAPKPKGPQGGSTMKYEDETYVVGEYNLLTDWQPTDEEIIEIAVKYFIMRSPIITMPWWFIEGSKKLLPEPAPTAQ